MSMRMLLLSFVIFITVAQFQLLILLQLLHSYCTALVVISIMTKTDLFIWGINFLCILMTSTSLWLLCAHFTWYLIITIWCLNKQQAEHFSEYKENKKPCCRKGGRAMRHIYGCPGQFWKSLATPIATIPEIGNELLSGEVYSMTPLLRKTWLQLN